MVRLQSSASLVKTVEAAVKLQKLARGRQARRRIFLRNHASQRAELAATTARGDLIDRPGRLPAAREASNVLQSLSDRLVRVVAPAPSSQSSSSRNVPNLELDA